MNTKCGTCSWLSNNFFFILKNLPFVNYVMLTRGNIPAQVLPAFTYCKRRKAGQGPGNEANLLNIIILLPLQQFEEAMKLEQAEKHALEKQLMALQQRLQGESSAQRELTAVKKQYAFLSSILFLHVDPLQ